MSSIPGVSTQIPKQRVLLVDDSKIVRTTLARLIRKSFEVREEANGETGWQAITTDPSIVVVFSDIQMPVLDGFALLNLLGTVTTLRYYALHLQQGLLPRPARLVLPLPIHRGV